MVYKLQLHRCVMSTKVKTSRIPRPLNLKNNIFGHTENIPDHIPDVPVIVGGNKVNKVRMDKNIQKIIDKCGKNYHVLLEHTESGVDIKFYTLETFPNPKHLPRDTILILLDLHEFLSRWKLMSKEGLEITSTWNPTMTTYRGTWIPR